jgi:trans-aconitate methyltransferase
MGKVWFGGDRTVAQQMVGLERLMEYVSGKTVLDVGCAEGDIAYACHKNGASYVHGVEFRELAYKAAVKQFSVKSRVSFAREDANVWSPGFAWDIVLLLAVLHKLRDPTQSLIRLANSCKDLCVIKVPDSDWPILRDDRSGNKPHNLEKTMEGLGFVVDHVCEGPTVAPHPAEFIAYYKRVDHDRINQIKALKGKFREAA